MTTIDNEWEVVRRCIRSLDDAINQAKVTNATKHKMIDLRANLMLRLDVIVSEKGRDAKR